MAELILFSISALPVILLARYIYKHDKNKEPAKLLAKLFLGGIISCFLVLIVSGILGAIFPIFAADYETLNVIELFIYVFIGVAFVEELCKWIMAYFISYNDKAFEEIYDMIVYCVFVSLGFAFFENLLYVYQNGVATGILRAILAVPGHACDGVFMGYYLGVAKVSSLNGRVDLKNKNLMLSVIVPMILHGIYDYCLFIGNGFFLIIFIVFIIMLYKNTISKIKSIAAINKKIKYKDKYCGNCGHIVESAYCPLCGRKND